MDLWLAATAAWAGESSSSAMPSHGVAEGALRRLLCPLMVVVPSGGVGGGARTTTSARTPPPAPPF